MFIIIRISIFECQILDKIGFYAKKSKQYWTAPSTVCDDIAETCNEILGKLIKFKIKLRLQPFIKTFCFAGEILSVLVTLKTPLVFTLKSKYRERQKGEIFLPRFLRN